MIDVSGIDNVLITETVDNIRLKKAGFIPSANRVVNVRGLSLLYHILYLYPNTDEDVNARIEYIYKKSIN